MNRPAHVCFKRFEHDREFRIRLLMHPAVQGALWDQARNYGGYALDAVGDFVGCQRRIVEESRP